MKSLALKIVCVFLLSLTISCGGGEGSTNEITFRLIAEGPDSNYSASGNIISTPQLLVIKNQNDFETFWDYHTGSDPPPPMPSINFAEEIVLALIDIVEPTSGYVIEITDIIESESNIYVNALKSIPGQNCRVLNALTHPYQIVAIQFTEKTIELRLTETAVDCN